MRDIIASVSMKCQENKKLFFDLRHAPNTPPKHNVIGCRYSPTLKSYMSSYHIKIEAKITTKKKKKLRDHIDTITCTK